VPVQTPVALVAQGCVLQLWVLDSFTVGAAVVLLFQPPLITDFLRAAQEVVVTAGITTVVLMCRGLADYPIPGAVEAAQLTQAQAEMAVLA
jgi:hypothetical protein